MQKFTTPVFTTGEFAKLCGTNKRTLIYYDEIGLFRPQKTDAQGYRYYSEQQCDIFTVITALKELGMPLKSIKQFLDSRNSSRLLSLLKEKKEEVNHEIERLKRIQQLIETRIALLEQAEQISFNQPIIETMPEEYMILSSSIHSSNHTMIIHTIYQHFSKCIQHGWNEGHPYGAMLDSTPVLENNYEQYAYFFTKVLHPPIDSKEVSVHIKPAGTYLTAYLKGDYYQAAPIFKLMKQTIQKENFMIGPYFYKEGIIDEVAETSSDEFITKISVQIL